MLSEEESSLDSAYCGIVLEQSCITDRCKLHNYCYRLCQGTGIVHPIPQATQ